MKTIPRILLSIVVISVLSPSAMASRSVNDIATICKTEAAYHFGKAEQPVRVKFKGVYGPRHAKRVLLQVLPEEKDSFKAICKMDSRTGQVLSLSRKS